MISCLSDDRDLCLMVLPKGTERYLFVFDSRHRVDVLRTFGRFASHPELSFTWYDAAVLSQRVRQLSMSQSPNPPTS